MSDSPAVILFDLGGVPTAVSGGMVMPTTGYLGQMITGLDASGFVRYLTVVSGGLYVTAPQAAPLWVTGSVSTTVQSTQPTVLDMSGTLSGNVSFGPFELLTTLGFAVQATVNAFPGDNASGSCYISVTNDPPGASPVYYIDLSGSSVDGANTFAMLSGSSSKYLANLVDFAVAQAKWTWVHTGGTGSLHVAQMSKS